VHRAAFCRQVVLGRLITIEQDLAAERDRAFAHDGVQLIDRHSSLLHDDGPIDVAEPMR
jgi:hypothetical protein